MTLWTVLATGEGLAHDGGLARCELYGVVAADDAGAALSRAVQLAAQQWPELQACLHAAHGDSAIHAEAINETEAAPGVEIDLIDVSWEMMQPV
jgi:hypothetical protein